ncbi:terminase gpA endonuclease subunit [Pokkaliibacter sp. CJK22405]|uniref:terminase gpA endonuclease subunit n=1 Tax=Pokkaliibacter sp. CJK22405 TaxID=3384615 RepID=UPI003984DC8D
MPETAPEPGPVRPERNPYIIPAADACSDPRYRRIIFITGTQAGKSFLLECVIGHRADDDPSPTIYYAPTEANITKKVEPVITAMIQQSKSLLSKLSSSSTQYVKILGAARIYLSWMGSTTETASTSARTVIIDELDRCSKNAEGSVVELAEARGEAYADSILLITGTPVSAKIERQTNTETRLQYWEVKTDWPDSWSPTWQQWQSGTRHEWAVPCPHCGEYFIPWSGLLSWPGFGSDNECSVDDAERHAFLMCPNNGCCIEDRYRQAMNQKGRAVAPGQSIDKEGVVHGTSITASSSSYSLWVSGLCSFSAKKTYGYCAKKLYQAIKSGDPDIIKPVYNTTFGECYVETGNAPKSDEVRTQSWRYSQGDVAPGFEHIFASVDVQKNRLVYVVRAWYAGMCSLLVDEGVLWGDTQQPAVWDALEALLYQDFSGYSITEMGVDCGYRPDEVFQFVAQHKGLAKALRGQSLDQPYRVFKEEKNTRGKTKKHGLARWEFDSSRAKTWVHSRIGRDKALPSWWLLPADISDEYCKEIVGEEFNERQLIWKKVGENHRLDCEAMQYMMARMRHLDRKGGSTLLPFLSKKPDAELSENAPAIPPADDDIESEAEVLERLQALQASIDAKKKQPTAPPQRSALASLAQKMNGSTR